MTKETWAHAWQTINSYGIVWQGKTLTNTALKEQSFDELIVNFIGETRREASRKFFDQFSTIH